MSVSGRKQCGDTPQSKRT